MFVLGTNLGESELLEGFNLDIFGELKVGGRFDGPYLVYFRTLSRFATF